MPRRLFLAWFAVWSLVPLPPARGAEPPAGELVPVGPGDLVSIIVFPATEYNREVLVQPDGKIELPLIGAVSVKGKTSREIQRLLEDKYKRFVENPSVTVTIRQFSGRKLAIIGEVRSPGQYAYRDGMKLLELVSVAGGLSDMARPAKTNILRPGLSPKAMRVNFQAVLDGQLDRDPALQPGDTIYIPKSPYAEKAGWITANALPWTAFIAAVSGLVLASRSR